MKFSKFLLIVFLTTLTFLHVSPVKADDGGSDDKSDDKSDDSNKLPIDNQVIFLVVAGVAIGIKVIADESNAAKKQNVIC